MQHNLLTIIVVTTLGFASSCSTHKILLNKSETELGTIKFYLDNKSQSDFKNSRFFVTVDNTIFYSFYSDKIVKQTRQDKNLIKTLFYGSMPSSFDTTAFQKLSSLDSSILMHGDRILDSLKLTSYKKSTGATAFEVEINYYHGYPDNKVFRPQTAGN